MINIKAFYNLSSLTFLCFKFWATVNTIYLLWWNTIIIITYCLYLWIPLFLWLYYLSSTFKFFFQATHLLFYSFSILAHPSYPVHLFFLLCDFIFSLLYFLTAYLLPVTLILSLVLPTLSHHFLFFIQTRASANFLCLGCSSSSSHFISVSNVN